MSALAFFDGEVVRCDGCDEMHNDVVQCHCGIVRCPACREGGCPRCDPKPSDRYWRGGAE